MLRRLPILAVSFLVTACALDVAGPHTDLDALPEGLEVQLSVEPGEVEQHEPFTVELTVTNTTSETIQVVTAHGCLVIPHVLRSGRRVPFEGSAWGCTSAITTHTLVPAETRTRTWTMRATLYAQDPGDVEGAPAPKGMYIVQAEFDTLSENEPHRNPIIQRTLRVQ